MVIRNLAIFPGEIGRVKMSLDLFQVNLTEPMVPAHQRTLELLRFSVQDSDWDYQREAHVLPVLLHCVVGVIIPPDVCEPPNSVPEQMVHALEELNRRCVHLNSSRLIEQSIGWLMETYRLPASIRRVSPVMEAIEKIITLREYIEEWIYLGDYNQGGVRGNLHATCDGMKVAEWSTMDNGLWGHGPRTIAPHPSLEATYSLKIEELDRVIADLEALKLQKTSEDPVSQL